MGHRAVLDIVAMAGWSPLEYLVADGSPAPSARDSELAICRIRFGNPDFPYLINLHLIDFREPFARVKTIVRSD
jgi:hypothetical protein